MLRHEVRLSIFRPGFHIPHKRQGRRVTLHYVHFGLFRLISIVKVHHFKNYETN